MNKRIDYKGTDITEIYKLALIGAEFVTEKNKNGITLVNSLNKELYMKTVLLARFLNVINIPEDRVMNLEQYKDNDFTVESFGGKDVRKLRADYNMFTSMLDDEIANCLVRENDFTSRLNETIKADMSPENLELIRNNSNELISQIEKITQAVKEVDGIKLTKQGEWYEVC